jgi:hypothetical protein
MGGAREHPGNPGLFPNFLTFQGFDRAVQYRTERRSTQECRVPGAKPRLLVFSRLRGGSFQEGVQGLEHMPKGLTGLVKSRHDP